MSRSSASKLGQAGRTLAILLGSVLVAVSLSSSPLTVTELAAVSLVVLALASALADRPQVVTAPPWVLTGSPSTGVAGPPVLRTRKTDPTHHPLAPRAPGLV